MPKTIQRVIVHHSDGLHKCITNRRSHKLEASFPEILAHRVGLRCARGNILQRLPFVLLWGAANKLPDIGIKTAELLLDLQETARIFDGSRNLEPVAHDTWIREKLFH